ncbi:hypothetical protein M2277_000852 [Paenibacillus sp. LBL]|nr:hypothetical protein [Paenibacillus sp. LBL]
METKQDTELINIIMNCELDYDYRIHAAKEVIKRIEEGDTTCKTCITRI